MCHTSETDKNSISTQSPKLIYPGAIEGAYSLEQSLQRKEDSIELYKLTVPIWGQVAWAHQGYQGDCRAELLSPICSNQSMAQHHSGVIMSSSVGTGKRISQADETNFQP